jgi:intein/homing endonuclease
MAKENKNLFRKLTDLFRSGPVVKRKIKNINKTSSKSSLEVFKKAHSDVYNSTLSAYGSYDRMARYSDFSEMEACIAGDTLIATPNGYTEIQELAKQYGPDETFIVYAYDHEKQQIVPAIGKQARHTATEMSHKITFDSGKTLIATPDHRVMRRDGTYCEVQRLEVGDSMMPFYRKALFDKDKDSGKGYQWIYTMNKEDSTLNNGWISEHRVVAEWAAGRKIKINEHVHHKNFIRQDNRPENLQIMDAKEHLAYHANILNGKKWDYKENSAWIENFKKNHSKFMKENNPVERKDVTFAKILQVCDRDGYNWSHLQRVFDCSSSVITNRLRDFGFSNFTSFAKAYDPNWKNNDWNNKDNKNPRYDKTLTYQKICDAFKEGISCKDLANDLNTTISKINNRIKNEGHKNFTEFKSGFCNHKVTSIEPYKVIDLYDLTVDGYKNYATDSIIVHNTPEISSALDIYSEECVSQDVEGNVLHVYSENRMIKKLLHELFYDTLNIDFNLAMWARNLCKYGDFFLFNDIHPEFGVVNVFPIPIAEMEREEGFDPEDPGAVRFRWVTQGNKMLENWQISHFRLLGNDAFLPYGSSVLEGARRVWRQLILIEDAMLVYRVIRSPERRVFYIDVGNIPPENIADYLEQAQTSLKRNAVIDKTTGQVDLRYNPLSVDEDYFLPVRGGESGTRIDTLAGGSNTTAIEDVEYIQKKLFAALKIPKAYLGYDEDIGAKATLAQEDIRFSRTIQRIQKTIVSELNKIAMIHLYTNGYKDESLLDFTLKLSNPSSIAQQQKLELIRTKFDIASAAPEGFVDKEWIRKHIIDLNDDEIARIEKGRVKDKLRDMELEGVQLPQQNQLLFGDEGETQEDNQQSDSSDSDLFGSSGGDEGESGGDEGESGLGDIFSGEKRKGKIMSEDELSMYDSLISEDEDKDEDEDEDESSKSPIRPSSRVNSLSLGITSNDLNPKLGGLGAQSTGIQATRLNFNKNPVSVITARDLMDGIMPQSPVVDRFIDKQITHRLSIDLEKMTNSLNIGSKNKLLRESNDEDYDIVIDDNLFKEEDKD